MSEFGSRIRQLRRDKGLTQRDLASKIGLDFTYLSKIETGTLPPPSEAAIARMAEALGTDHEFLLALARKVPADLRRTLQVLPVEASILVRRLQDITPSQYAEILAIVDPTHQLQSNGTR